MCITERPAITPDNLCKVIINNRITANYIKVLIFWKEFNSCLDGLVEVEIEINSEKVIVPVITTGIIMPVVH